MAYRYAVMKGSVEFFHSWYGITLLSAYCLLYPTLAHLSIIYSLDDREKTLEYVKLKAPNIYDLYSTGPCNCFMPDKVIIYAAAIFFHIIFVMILGLWITLKTLKTIQEQKSSLSSTTYKLYCQFVRTLICQITVPFGCIGFPVFLLLILVLLEHSNVKNISSYVMQGIFLHSVVNSITVLLSIKVYRVAMFRILCCFAKPKNQTIPAPNTSVLTE